MRSRTLILIAAVGALALVLPSAAAASVASEQQQGARIVKGLKGKVPSKAKLTTGQYERVGDYVMGQMLGSTRAHESMDRLMHDMMGERGEEQMHAFLGRRYLGSGNARLPGGYARMMGMMGMMGVASGSVPAGMMGGSQQGFAPGTMNSTNGAGEDDGWGTAAVVVVLLLGAALAAALLALLAVRPWRRGGGSAPFGGAA